jgi:hypothetical protein
MYLDIKGFEYTGTLVPSHTHFYSLVCVVTCKQLHRPNVQGLRLSRRMIYFFS